MNERNWDEALGRIATETLAAFEMIAVAADKQLGKRSAGVHSFASINEFNTGTAVDNLNLAQLDVAAAYRQLRDEPAIARLVIADENESQQTLYISRNTSVSCDLTLCSSLSAKGRLASLPVGGGMDIALAEGRRWYEVVERTVFKPFMLGGDWDARNAVVQSEAFGPVSVQSLRSLLAQAGWSEDDLDLLERQLAEDDAEQNVRDGVKRSVLTAMELRDQPILDQFQDEIFRLPIDCQLAILGPAGTGKTTTLVRRLRQKIDAEWLTDDERELIGQAAETGQGHAQSWLMFTPTDLLKHYVREAFAREGVPAPDSRIRTWEEHRRDLARRSLPILKSSTGGTLVLGESDNLLLPGTITDQVAWFEDFDTHQIALFAAQLAEQAAVLERGGDVEGQRLGTLINALLINASGRPIAALAALAGLAAELRRLATDLGDSIGGQLRRSLAQHLRHDDPMLADLGRFLISLAGVDEEEDDLDDDDEEDESLTPGSKKAATAAYLRAVRSAAVAQARGRAAPTRGRTGAVLRWLRERGVAFPELKPIGEAAAVQQSARRLVTAPAAYVRGVPARYRVFRRERLVEERWYAAAPARTPEVSPLEVDVILLALLRNARAVLDDGGLMRRLGDRARHPRGCSAAAA